MDFKTLLNRNNTILLDGAIGTQLDKRGLMSRGRNNLDNPQAVLEILKEYADCGDLDPAQMADVVSLLSSATTQPVLAQPNAGLPQLIDDKTVFDMAPADFAEGIAKCINAGARIVGGCCGTTPEHILAVAEAISSR